MQAASVTEGRQFGLDWLRIGAFALLILYHIGMFFVPWGWHVKTAEPVEWAQWPMMAISPWRLLLLFVISGLVSRALMAKLNGASRFASSRSMRLLIPLLAGMVLFVVPQPWFELRDQGKYGESFLNFWLNDYFEFGGSRGTPLPTWNHLWFVAYLWVYSMVLAGLCAMPPRFRSQLQKGFDGLFSGWRFVVLPIIWLALSRLVLFPAFGETHALVDDPYAHAIYGFAFFFGFGLARSQAVWTMILSLWKRLLIVAPVSCCALLTAHGLGDGEIGWDAARAALRAVLAWCVILGMLGLAQAHFHHDGPVRRYLTEAIFPYYIAHQTIIVAAGSWLKEAEVGAGFEFGGILLATLMGCALTYEVARRSSWLRPVLGLKMRIRVAAKQPRISRRLWIRAADQSAPAA